MKDVGDQAQGASIAMRIKTVVFTLSVIALAFGCDRTARPADGGHTGTDAGNRDGGGGGSCTPTGDENTAAACMDGMDNDCDMHFDCNDFDCCSLVTCGRDTACGRSDAGMPGMACDGPATPENTIEACSDGCSNDHDMDTFVDCNDRDCCDVRTDCPPDTQCGMGRCSGEPAPENTLAACTDGCSNDGDGFADCEEIDCCWVLAEAAERGVSGVTACGAGSFCADSFTPPTTAQLCESDDLMGPPVAENSYERCSDECASDRDRFQDCGDFDCCGIIARAVAEGVEGAAACAAGTACADSWTPREGVELCDGDDGTGEPTPEATEALCSNDCDDDRDGFEDCDDFDCCDVRSDCPASSNCGMRTDS